MSSGRVEVQKWALSSVDSWVEMEALPGVLPNRSFSGWQAWRFPDASLGPGGGVPQAFLRWGLWGLALLGLKQIAVSLVWNGSLDNGMRFGIWYPALFGLCSLIIFRSQPAYSALFAVAGSMWCSMGDAPGLLRSIELFPGVASCLFLVLVIEWRRCLGKARMAIYILGFLLNGILLPALILFRVLGDRYLAIVMWYLMVGALVIHTERCFRLGVRKTIRSAFIVGAVGGFGAVGALILGLPGWSVAGTGTHQVAYSLLSFMPVGCLLFEWAHRRKLNVDAGQRSGR